jgi:hypothetical protein
LQNFLATHQGLSFLAAEALHSAFGRCDVWPSRVGAADSAIVGRKIRIGPVLPSFERIYGLSRRHGAVVRRKEKLTAVVIQARLFISTRKVSGRHVGCECCL